MFLFLDGIEQVGFSVGEQFEDKLSEQRVLPCEPGACVSACVVLVERLVAESRSCVGVNQRLQALAYLLVVG